MIKSDELGVPYYQQHDLCDADTRILVYSPVSGGFFTRAPCQPHQQMKTLI